jgi:hypothetical protein
MRGAPSFVLGIAVAVQGIGVAPFDVSTLTVSEPKMVCELDANLLKGEVQRLSWSPESTSIHVQTIDGDRRLRDYIVTMPDGVVSVAFGEPEWAAAYWRRKSNLSAPGVASLQLEVTQNNRRTRPTPFGGGFANGGAQTFDPKNPVDAYEAEVTLRLLGEEISNWVNGFPVAGETFGWGPTGSAAILFTDGKRIAFMDQKKNKKVIAAAKGATMPAWSDDGSRIVFLQKAGRRKYHLMSASVTFPPAS